MNDIMKPHFRKEYGEAEVKKLEKRVDRLEEIKNKVETWESDMILNREEAEYLLQRLERYEKVLKKTKEKSQIFASHIAYCKDKYYSVDPLDTFNKAQAIFEMLEEALREDE